MARESRRNFLRRASALTLTIPGLGIVLTACGDGERERTARQTREPGGAAKVPAVSNPDSKLDTAAAPAGAGTVAGGAGVPFHTVDAALPPLGPGRVRRVHFHAKEAPIRISDDTVVGAWTFEGEMPGPVIHCRVGDRVEFTITNDVAMPHSMDFHAAQIDPKTAFRSALKGQSVSFSFTPRYAGAFLYHCGTSPVLLHLGSGMFGAIIVSPRAPLPRAREFVLVQSELYLGPAVNGVRPFDYARMLSTLPDYVAFNGRPDQYGRAPLRVRRGDRVRFWVVNAGPTHPCAFHVVGEQFDTVYLGAPPGSAIHGIQTWGVPAGAGMCFELVADVVGEFVFVNHAFGHGQKGAIGRLVVA
ncbi:MAG TPA: multicopper oxidase domain-containing protein [Gemmatimonadales bacterium]